ncbi:MAG: DNA-directed RNA polymerase, subunit H [archaeon GW2011_AR20]|nr:MAG: DNA-directed RNA polymerase, subunit H [archaeon GW2011_AR20]MBS3160154.1 DNA-directed RNA polymerase subunit H [Candidatus Woesearchaeota archaeon]
MPEEIDITKHEFVPRHIKLTEEQTEEVLKKFNISKKQLPRVLKEDPALSKLDVKKGDVVKITRKSPTTGESEFYRVVI